jgi:Ala-tRNA(Pro) deacylase
MPLKQLKDLLDNQHVKYTLISHSPSFTAQEIAAAAHISGKQLAKIVVIKIGKQLAMVVLPAADHVNFNSLKKITGSTDVDLASEMDFKGKFPGCEVGAMPPFGSLFENMPVFVSNHLSHLALIAFNAGTHSELIQMAYQDFERLAKPKVIDAT